MPSTFTPSHRGGSGPPMVCLHGFTSTWRTWELVLPALERHHDVLALTLPGHAGGPAIGAEVSTDEIVDVVEQAMDEAGFAAAHIVGNSLGGYLGLRLAARGRARTVVALAPAGGSAVGDGSSDDTLALFATWQEILREIARDADALMQTALSLRDASSALTTSYEHIPPELLAHHLDAAANCDGMAALIATAHREGYELDAGRVTCPVRIVWGTDDRVLPWPSSAVRYVHEWMPDADWVKLAGVGHCPQLDVPRATAELIVAFTSR